MAVGIGKDETLLKQDPLREGCGMPHNFFLARLSQFPDVIFKTFFVYGSTACYVSNSLAKKLRTYHTSSISTISGVGGRGPTITKDSIISVQFQTNSDKDSTWAEPIVVSAGVAPDNIFPADLTLGQTVFHALGLKFLQNGSIQSLNLPRTPILNPCNLTQLCPSASFESIFITNDAVIKWHPSTPAEANNFTDFYIYKFPSLFKKNLRSTNKNFKTQHSIDTSDHKPIKLPPRRYSPAQQQAIRDFYKAPNGSIIQKSKSPWAAPLLLTPKKVPTTTDKTIWRICVDYRQLNKITKKHAHPLPNAQDEIQRAAGHKYYAFLDLENGFWQIPLEESTREKTAFITPFGVYEWLVMPLGLCNAPATFQCFMEEVLEPFRPFVAGLLDDVAVWGNSILQFNDRLILIFSRFVEYGLFLIQLNADCISADPQKAAAIKDRPMPTTTSEIRGFVNAAGYLRSLIRNFSELAGPLTDQSTGLKNAPVTLSQASIQSWECIKNAITSTPVLTKIQQRYSAQERELLGILLAIQHWRHWIERGDITVVTDHESLKTIQTKFEQPLRMVRFLDAIEHYNIKIIYRPGKANVLADYLSRPCDSEFPIIERGRNAVEDEGDDLVSLGDDSRRTETSELEEVRHPHQLNRIDLQCIFECLSVGQALPQKITEDWVTNNFTIYKNKLHLIRGNQTQGPENPLGPLGSATLLEILEYQDLMTIIATVHENQGHASVGITMREAERRYWHPELMLAVYEGIDHMQVGPQILLNAVEYATGWLESRLVPNADFKNTMPLLLYRIRNFGTPKQIISDNPNCFTGIEARQFQTKYGLTVTHTTLGRPQSNGKIEKVNGVLKSILTRVLLDTPNLKLVDVLSHANMFFNRRIAPTGYSPYFLLFGTQPPEEEQAYPAYTREATLQEEQDWASDLARSHAAP
ncbi:hypothetical protein K3495_g12100, partial [Podosphaera aphanis]